MITPGFTSTPPLVPSKSSPCVADIAAFTPTDLNPALWLENKVEARTAWNEAGKQLDDSSGNGNNGTASTGIGIDFNATNVDYIDIGSNSNFDKDSTFTIRVDYQTGASGVKAVYSQRHGALENSTEIGIDTNDKPFVQVYDGSFHVFRADTAITVTQAYQITFVKKQTTYANSTDWEIHVDGVNQTLEVGVGNSVPPTNGQGLIGRARTLGGDVDKTLNNLKMFTDVQTSTDSLEAYNNPQQRFPSGSSEAALFAYYKLSDLGEDAFTVFDYSGNDNHGTFSTTAASPYDPFVTGLSTGYQTALGGFNQYGVTAGTGTVSSSGTSVTGVGTLFTTEYAVNDVIFADNEGRRITAITDNTNMTVSSAFTSALSSATHDRYNLGDSGTYEVNIFGTAYNSSTDIFGNALEWFDGVLTLKDQNNFDAIIINNPSWDYTANGATLFFVVKMPNYVAGDEYFFSHRTGGGLYFSMDGGASTRRIRVITTTGTGQINGTTTIDHDSGEWWFLAARVKADGTGDVWYGDESNDMADVTNTLINSTPLTNATGNIVIADFSTGAGDFNGMMGMGIVALSQLTEQNLKDLRTYWINNVLNAA